MELQCLLALMNILYSDNVFNTGDQEKAKDSHPEASHTSDRAQSLDVTDSEVGEISTKIIMHIMLNMFYLVSV